ncbi:MAG TPA: hypothetical protein VGG19_00075 [Tepidisphaeraceae bacterium]|jgi:predicted nucleic acid-binding protein
MKRFADTHFFLALINASDSSHALARTYLQDQQAVLVTSEWVLPEVADGLALRHLRHTFLNLMKQLCTFPKSIIAHADHATFELAFELYTNRSQAITISSKRVLSPC